ncbi:MAG: hypothetical protein ABIO70_06850 [Pseudomonadota bacterium]
MPGAWVLALLLALPVRADEGPQEWAELYEARLLDSADAATETTAFNLQSLLNRLNPSDPLYGQVAYWLAHAYVCLDEHAQAHEALAIAAEAPDSRDAALALQAQIDSIERTIKRLPLRADMDNDPGPFVHSWLFGDRGWLELGTPQGEQDQALRWATIVQDRHDDQISLHLGPGATGLEHIAMNLKAENFPAFVRVLLEDAHGREFATDPFPVPTDSWLPVDLDRRSFHSTDPTTPRARPAAAVRVLHVHDVTTYLSSDRGPRVVWIDDLSLE